MDISEIISTTQKQNQFRNKGIETVEELLRFFPRKYADFTQITTLEKRPREYNVEGAFVVNIDKIEEKISPKLKINYVCLEGRDAVSDAKIKVFWFRQKLVYKTFEGAYAGTQYFVAGKAEYNYFNGFHQISMPTVFTRYTPGVEKIYPIYSKITGMSDDYLRDSIKKALASPAAKEEPYPVAFAEKYGYPSCSEAIRELHQPTSTGKLDLALERMKFDILVNFSRDIRKNAEHKNRTTPYKVTSVSMARTVWKNLPYQLTQDQTAAIRQILRDMAAGNRVDALIQGDVGSGKSIVAFLLMTALAENGYQTALMASSKVLAQQHYTNLSRLLEPYGVRVALCNSISAMKKKEQKELLEGVQSGEIKIVIGTNSLLSDKLRFQNLALIVTDEEHKFGVLQKETLVERERSGVHSIMMSATPIPRSLVQVIYGDDMQLYTIKTMPSGRKPVKTEIVSDFDSAFKKIEEQLGQGRQVFVVCPQIEASESADDIASVKEITDIYLKHFSALGYVVMTLTGKTKKEDAKNVIQQFEKNQVQILIATTVVEVGVNIPNATVMVIQNAERFGLSSLHQLRGRVGRAGYQSYCLLFSADKENSRLQTMVRTNSGFEIARADMEKRGPGDWLGTEQSGNDNMAVKLMLAYPELYQKAKDASLQIYRL